MSQRDLRWNAILLAQQQQQPKTKLTNNILNTKKSKRSVYNPLLPKENYWYAKNKINKDFLLETTKDEDSFVKGMEDLNDLADHGLKKDLRALQAKEMVDRQV